MAGFEASTSNVHVPKEARKKIFDVFRPRNAEKDQASADSHANQNRIGNPSGLVPTALTSDNYKACSKNNGPKYDPELLMSKRIIFSDVVRKTRLVNRDEQLEESSTKKILEDDETFFENLKKHINKDLQKNVIEKFPKPLPKRLPNVRKRKRLLDNESLNLMKKFRGEIKEKGDRMPSEDNGVFSIEHRSNSQNQENIYDQPVTPQSIGNSIIWEHKMASEILLEYFETDENSLCATPSLNEIDTDAHNLQLTPSSSQTTI